MTRSGNGFVKCSDGHLRWGRFGASGVVFVHREAVDTTVMLQKRSAMAHEGGTWSCAGGALDEGEDALSGAMREAFEEVGEIPDGWRVLGQTVFAPTTDWSYTTFVVEVERRFGSSLNFETDDVAWVAPDEVSSMPLHAGFAAAWPELHSIIASTSG